MDRKDAPKMLDCVYFRVVVVESRVVGMGWIREPMVSTETGLRPEIIIIMIDY